MSKVASTHVVVLTAAVRKRWKKLSRTATRPFRRTYDGSPLKAA
jgi:hypothetical protein